MKFEKFYESLTTEQRKVFNKYQKERQDERTIFTWVTCALGSAAMTAFIGDAGKITVVGGGA